MKVPRPAPRPPPLGVQHPAQSGAPFGPGQLAGRPSARQGDGRPHHLRAVSSPGAGGHGRDGRRVPRRARPHAPAAGHQGAPPGAGGLPRAGRPASSARRSPGRTSSTPTSPPPATSGSSTASRTSWCWSTSAARPCSDVMKQGPVAAGARGPHRAADGGALGAAHANGIVHRDVKPRNVMLVEGEDDLVKLIDFGLARVPVEHPELGGHRTRTSRASRSPPPGWSWAPSPTWRRRRRWACARSSRAAISTRSGIILYEMLAGKHPFDAVDPALLFAQHRNDPPPPLRLRNPSVVVPDLLEAVVRKLLEKEPDDRYPNAAAAVAALDDAMPPSQARDTPLSNATDLPITVLGMRSPSVIDPDGGAARRSPRRTSLPVRASRRTRLASSVRRRVPRRRPSRAASGGSWRPCSASRWWRS